MAIQRLLLLLPVAGAAFVAASPLPRPASVRPVLPRASVPVAVVPPPLAAALPPAVSTLRGGLLAARAPESLFNLLFLGLSGACAALVVGTRSQQQSGDSDTPAEKPEMVKAVSALKWRFLAVFWLYKMADWLQGPYFYDVYASKIINGVQVNSEGVARLFLMGFGSTAVFGAAIGGLVDSAGRKRGSLAFALMYTLSALSTRALTLPLLLGGRLVGGIGTSLLFSVRRAIRRRNSARNSFGAQFCAQFFRRGILRAILQRPLSTHRHRRRGSSPSTRGARCRPPRSPRSSASRTSATASLPAQRPVLLAPILTKVYRYQSHTMSALRGGARLAQGGAGERGQPANRRRVSQFLRPTRSCPCAVVAPGRPHGARQERERG